MKILLIDHHQLFRDGLRHVLQRLPGGLGELLEAASWGEGLQCIGRRPDMDVILLELLTPGCTGVKAVELLRRRYPHIPLVVVSADETPHLVDKVLECGASGYVGKSSPAPMLLGALSLVSVGGIYVPPQLLKYRLNPKARSLTQRQKQVLECLSEGCSNKKIAERLNLAEGTVRAHVGALYQTLRVNSRIEAMRVASNMGLAGNATSNDVPGSASPKAGRSMLISPAQDRLMTQQE